MTDIQPAPRFVSNLLLNQLWPILSDSLIAPSFAALLVAPAHSALGGDEEDGGKEKCGTQSHQLHRGPQTVPRSGEYKEISTLMVNSFICG